MKPLLIVIGLLMCFDGCCQKYQVGLKKTGSVIKNLEGEIIVSDSVVTSNIDGLASTLKITSRSGYTIHVTDGTSPSKYVIGHHAGRQHGFTYDRSVTYHPAKNPAGTSLSVYYCVIKHD